MYIRICIIQVKCNHPDSWEGYIRGKLWGGSVSKHQGLFWFGAKVSLYYYSLLLLLSLYYYSLLWGGSVSKHQGLFWFGAKVFFFCFFLSFSSETGAVHLKKIKKIKKNRASS